LFVAACHYLGIRHLRTRSYTPRTNGKAERFIQTAQREWAARLYQSRERQPSSNPGFTTTTGIARILCVGSHHPSAAPVSAGNSVLRHHS
jgi:transposase InsO family protein